MRNEYEIWRIYTCSNEAHETGVIIHHVASNVIPDAQIPRIVECLSLGSIWTIADKTAAFVRSN